MRIAISQLARYADDPSGVFRSTTKAQRRAMAHGRRRHDRIIEGSMARWALLLVLVLLGSAWWLWP